MSPSSRKVAIVIALAAFAFAPVAESRTRQPHRQPATPGASHGGGAYAGPNGQGSINDSSAVLPFRAGIGTAAGGGGGQGAGGGNSSGNK